MTTGNTEEGGVFSQAEVGAEEMDALSESAEGGDAETVAAMEESVALARDAAVDAEASHAEEVATQEGDIKAKIMSQFETEVAAEPTAEEIRVAKNTADYKVGELWTDIMNTPNSEANTGLMEEKRQQLIEQIGATGEYNTAEVNSAIESGDLGTLIKAVNKYRNDRYRSQNEANDAKQKNNSGGAMQKLRKLFGKG
jgi:hypothetical protein